MEEHTKRSKVLRDASEKNRRKATELASEGMDEAAKRWLAVSLLCKQLRSSVEATMADIESARVQLLMQPDRPPSQTIERVNKVLRESATERERATQAFNRMSFITQVSVEQTMRELEGYGIKEKALNEEFQKLKQEAGVPSVAVGKEEEVGKIELPEVPKKEPETKPATKKEKEAEKVN